MDHYTLSAILEKPATTAGVRDDRVAVTFLDRSVTYDELADRSARLAAGLLAAGFRKGDRAAVLMHNRIEWIEILFALAKVGGVIVPLNYMLRAPELRFIVEDCAASWLFAEDRFAGVAGDIVADAGTCRTVLVGEGAYEALIDAGTEPVDVVVRADDLLLLQYTSGTTGFPKGAMHTHSTVLWNSYHQIPDFGLTSDDVTFVLPALCWAAGFHDLALATLWAGGRIVLSPSTGFSPQSFCETVTREGVTTCLLVPSVLKRVLTSGELTRHDMSSLRLVISGGEPVPVTALDDLREQLPDCSLVQVFGMSEFPTLMLLQRSAQEARSRPGSTGKACSIAQVRIVDELGNDVRSGETGEIICRSPACMVGYYGREDSTAATLAGGWLHTGDLARTDEDGYVYIAGRAKDMIISGGLNVYPAEIERAIAEHPAVVEAAVIGIPDDDWGEVGKAFVVVRHGDRVEESELASFLRERLATFKVPKTYELRADPLPRTTSGKVQKFLLGTPAPAP